MAKQFKDPTGYIQMPANILYYVIITNQTKLLKHMDICLIDLALYYLTVPKIEFEYVPIRAK